MSALKRIPKDTVVRDASHKRRGNIDAGDPVPAVVRDRAHKRRPARDEQPAPSTPVSIDKVVASASDIAKAAGAGVPLYRSGMDGMAEVPAGGAGGPAVILGNGNISYPSGATVILNPTAATPEAVRAIFLHAEQSVSEARTRLAAAIVDRNNQQRAVASKGKALSRATEHADAEFAKVSALKQQQAEVQDNAIADMISSGVLVMPRSAAFAIQLQAAEQASEIANQARGQLHEKIKELNVILDRANDIVRGHAFEVLIAESKLLALTAREAIQTAQQTLESLTALDAVSHRYATASARPQTISTEAAEVLKTHYPNAQHSTEQIDAWAAYIDRLSKDSTATKESQP